MSGDPNKRNFGVDRVESEEGEVNSLYERVHGMGDSEGVER